MAGEAREISWFAAWGRRDWIATGGICVFPSAVRRPFGYGVADKSIDILDVYTRYQ